MSDWLKQDGITVSSEMDGRASLSRMACPDHHGEELIFTFDWSAEDAAALDNPDIQIVWREPFCDMLYAWQPLCCTDKTQRITWNGPLSPKPLPQLRLWGTITTGTTMYSPAPPRN